MPTSALGRRVVVKGELTVTGCRTDSVKVSVSVGLPFWAFTNWKLPSDVGVPARTPCAESVRPVGSAGQDRPLRLDVATGRRVQGHDLGCGERFGVGLPDGRALQGLVLDVQPGIDVDAELTLRAISRWHHEARPARRSGRGSRSKIGRSLRSSGRQR